MLTYKYKREKETRENWEKKNVYLKVLRNIENWNDLRDKRNNNSEEIMERK